MDISPDDLEDLLKKQRIAHQLIAGFYLNILTLIDETAKKFNTAFWRWEPIETSTPGQAKTHPLTKWIWDYLPLYASQYYYMKPDMAPRCKKGDYILTFQVYCDYGFHAVQEEGYIEPCQLESGPSILNMFIYKAIDKSTDSFMDIFRHQTNDWVKPSEEWQDSGHPSVLGLCRSFELKDFIANPDIVVKYIVGALR